MGMADGAGVYTETNIMMVNRSLQAFGLIKGKQELI